MSKFLDLKIFLALLIFAQCALLSFKPNEPKKIESFSLKNIDGKLVSLNDYKNAKGFIIIFTCNHCPFAKLYPKRFNKLNSKYASQGVPLIAISSTDTLLYEEDGFSEMIKNAKNEHFNFPYLCDETQSVAKSFNAQKTPHAFVIWKENNEWVVKYNGAVDNNGAEEDQVTVSYVSDAVESLLSNQEIAIKESKSIGCQIHFRK